MHRSRHRACSCRLDTITCHAFNRHQPVHYFLFAFLPLRFELSRLQSILSVTYSSAFLLFFLLPVRKLIQNTTSIQAHLHSHVDMTLSVCVCRSYTVSYLLAAAKKIKVLVTEAINMIIVLWFAASGWSRRRQQLRDSWAKNRVWSQMWVHIRSTYLIYCHYKCQDGTLICHWAAYDGRRECLCCNAILRSNQTRICIFVRYTSRPSRYKNISIIIFLQYFLIALFDVALIACISGVFISAVKYSKPV